MNTPISPYEAAIANPPKESLLITEMYGKGTFSELPIFCGDDRSDGDHLHWFGGALKVPYNLAVLQEVAQPGSVTEPFAEQAASIVEVLKEVADAKVGVHSDHNTEGGHQLDKDRADGAVGCAYAESRPAISKLIGEMGHQIVSRAIELRPELFQNEEDDAFADEVVAAHARLAEREGFVTPGRRAVIAAAAKGAETTVVKGEHVADEAEINLWPNSYLRSDVARESGAPKYTEDEWSIIEAHDRIHHLYPYDKRQVQIAHLIDTIGTLKALGIELQNIHLRRNPDVNQ